MGLDIAEFDETLTVVRDLQPCWSVVAHVSSTVNCASGLEMAYTHRNEFESGRSRGSTPHAIESMKAWLRTVIYSSG